MLVALMAVMLISNSVTGLAATTNEVHSAQSRVVFDGSGSQKLKINTVYKTIAHVDPNSSIGFNAEIVILVTLNNSICTNDIRMLDKNKKVVWESKGAILYLGTRNFTCGPDVYEVQIRTQDNS